MSPWITPTEPTELAGDALRDHYQLILRRIRKWCLGQPESSELSKFWLELRDAERPLYRQGHIADVVSINAVIETAIQLGYSSDN
ncbi:hypothetical protein [Aurantimicrobium sp. MWH-Uga1]|uniref:hypothetical protein n=1 Tax=Aurantimicrobium sp. MWH-Uga1 TaxID=2079575 RepID=UPI000DED7B06|nr:hypothetical protein [Aurantimicrobium sp. MWH-Uga1]AXE54087.1 hypothetical protein AURUGA1_00380 [Aurantimicrobium sp. MWH-Uga1]